MPKCAGQCLHFDCALVLVLTLRKSITRLRDARLGWLLPLDRHVYYHKIIGWILCILSTVHAAAHVINFGTEIVNLLFPPFALLICCDIVTLSSDRQEFWDARAASVSDSTCSKRIWASDGFTEWPMFSVSPCWPSWSSWASSRTGLSGNPATLRYYLSPSTTTSTF